MFQAPDEASLKRFAVMVIKEVHPEIVVADLAR
jgi:hypothetical protein